MVGCCIFAAFKQWRLRSKKDDDAKPMLGSVDQEALAEAWIFVEDTWPSSCCEGKFNEIAFSCNCCQRHAGCDGAVAGAGLVLFGARHHWCVRLGPVT